MLDRYNILRYSANKTQRKPEVIRRGVSLKTAQEWCSREDTHKIGKWFDGYVKAG